MLARHGIASVAGPVRQRYARPHARKIISRHAALFASQRRYGERQRRWHRASLRALIAPGMVQHGAHDACRRVPRLVYRHILPSRLTDIEKKDTATTYRVMSAI